MESRPDHLQAHDVLGVDLGGGLHTHALQVPISFFRISWGMGMGEGVHESGVGMGDSKNCQTFLRDLSHCIWPSFTRLQSIPTSVNK